jgi:hypothetical protein
VADDQPAETLTPQPAASPESEADRIRRIGYGAEGLGVFLLLGLALLILITRSPSPGVFAWLLRVSLGAVGLAFWVGGIGLRRGWRLAAPVLLRAPLALVIVSIGVFASILVPMLREGSGGPEGFPLVPWSIAAVIAIPGLPLWAIVCYAWSLRQSLRDGIGQDRRPPASRPRTSVLAVIALVLSLPPLVACWATYERFPILEVSLAALALALVAQVQARRSLGRLRGLDLVRGVAAIYVVTILMYPMFLRERESRHKITCLAHAKDLTTAVRSYVEDHHGIYPPADYWSDALKSYVDADTFLCPHSTNKRCGFALNTALGGRRAADVAADPARLVLFLESDAGWNAHGGPELLSAEPRHMGGDNLGFPDGHVKWVGRLRQGAPSPPRWQRAYAPDTVIWDANVRREGEPSKGQAPADRTSTAPSHPEPRRGEIGKPRESPERREGRSPG